MVDGKTTAWVLWAFVALAGCGAAAEDTSLERDAEKVSAPTCNPTIAKGAVASKSRALLDTIAYTEGTAGHGQDGYNVTFGFHYFSSCDHHPHIRVCQGRLCSDAAGRYQFLSSTWSRLGYSSFHPDDQDRAGMKLCERRGAVVPTSRALTATEFVNVMDRISYEWASLPPGRYGQPSYSMSATRKKYCSFAGC